MISDADALVRRLAVTCCLLFAACSEGGDANPVKAAQRDAAKALENGDARLLLLSGVSGEGNVYWVPPGVICAGPVADVTRGLARPVAGPDKDAAALRAYAGAYNEFLVTRVAGLAAAGCEPEAGRLYGGPAKHVNGK